MSKMDEVKELLNSSLNDIEGLQAFVNEAKTKVESAQGSLILALGQDSGNQVIAQSFAMLGALNEKIDDIQGMSQEFHNGVQSYQAVLG